MALLAQANWLGPIVYILVDHVTFQLYKLARGDLIYWCPGVGYGLSSLLRFLIKTTTDFTGMV